MAVLAVTQMVTWWIETLFFVAIYPVFIYYSVRKGNCGGHEECEEPELSLRNISTDILLGGCILVISTLLLVSSARSISEIFGLNQFYVGLTVVALGCVVPELAVSVAAAIAGEQEIVIGNVISDNILTLCFAFGVVGLTSSFSVLLSEVLLITPFMVIETLMLFALNKPSNNDSRLWGVMMLTTACLTFIFQTSYTIV